MKTAFTFRKLWAIWSFYMENPWLWVHGHSWELAEPLNNYFPAPPQLYPFSITGSISCSMFPNDSYIATQKADFGRGAEFETMSLNRVGNVQPAGHVRPGKSLGLALTKH